MDSLKKQESVFCHAKHFWCSVRHQICNPIGCVFNSGQIVHTRVLLSPRSIIWNWQMGGEVCSWEGMAESNGSLPPEMSLVTCGLISQDWVQLLEPYTCNEYGTLFLNICIAAC